MSSSIQSRYLNAAGFNRLGKGVSYFGLAVLIAMTAATAQVAPLDTTGLDTSGNAKSEMATCKSGKTQQDRTACMTEVRNANAAKRAGKLNNGADYAANALKRCEIFKDSEDLAACRGRVQSEAKIDGTVPAGGVLRESEIVVPAKQ